MTRITAPRSRSSSGGPPSAPPASASASAEDSPGASGGGSGSALRRDRNRGRAALRGESRRLGARRSGRYTALRRGARRRGRGLRPVPEDVGVDAEVGLDLREGDVAFAERDRVDGEQP